MGVTRALILMAFGACAALSARAQTTEIFKCVDASGRASYTNDRGQTQGKKCEVVTTQVNVAPPPAPPKAPSPGSAFPRESASDRLSARSRQREVLEKELAAEQQGLARAQQELSQQEAVRAGDERNYARVLERLQPFRDRVETHEKNIEALKRELGTLHR